MGLDISAYQNIAIAPDAAVDEYGSPVDWENYHTLHQSLIDMTEKDFPGRTEGLVAGVYSEKDRFGFRAGSYSGYSEWRDDLCRMAHDMSASAFWVKPPRHRAFAELINFSDCEGYIGPVVAAKLSADFKQWADEAVRYAKTIGGGEYWLQTYKNFAEAFRMAAINGVVVFH
jgi:hypothetical protein